MLGLAQLFIYSMMQNTRSSEITGAVFLARQKIDDLRIMTNDELLTLSSPIEETLNPNLDGVADFRRITTLQVNGLRWDVRVLIFPGQFQNESAGTLLANPGRYKIRADIKTVITR